MPDNLQWMSVTVNFTLLGRYFCIPTDIVGASQVVGVVKNSPVNAGDTRDMCLIPGSGRSPGVGNGNSLQYS